MKLTFNLKIKGITTTLVCMKHYNCSFGKALDNWLIAAYLKFLTSYRKYTLRKGDDALIGIGKDHSRAHENDNLFFCAPIDLLRSLLKTHRFSVDSFDI